MRTLLAATTVQRLRLPQVSQTFTIVTGLGGTWRDADATIDSMLLGDTPLALDRVSVSTIGGGRNLDGIAGTAVVDTGAPFTMIMPSMLRRLGVTEQDLANDRSVKTHVLVGAGAEMRIHRFDTVRVGPVTAHNIAMPVLVHDPPPPGGGTCRTGTRVRRPLATDRGAR